MRLQPRRALTWLKVFFGNLGRSRTFGLAGEMAFWLFLSLLPIAAVAGLIVAKLAFSGGNMSVTLWSTVPPAVREMVAKELASVSAWNGGAVAPAAAATFVWLASSGVHSIFDGLELETEANARPWWKKRLLAIATCLALSVGFAAIAVLGVGVDWFEKLAGKTLPLGVVGRMIFTAARIAVGLALAVGLIAGLYWVGLPPRARRRMPILPGAVVAVLCQGALGVAYGVYVRSAGDGGAYQAGLAVIGVTLMVLYLFCVATLVGAEVNQVLGARRLLAASVHPAIAPPPPVTKRMVCCDHDTTAREGHLRPSFVGDVGGT